MSIYYIAKSVRPQTLQSCVLNVSKLVGITLLWDSLHIQWLQTLFDTDDNVFVVILKPVFWS